MKPHERLFTRNAGKCGRGVFAGKEFVRGEIIHIMSGEKLTLGELIRLVRSGKLDINDPLQVGKRTFILLDPFSRLFNHSCNPNVGLRKRSEMFALRDIKKNEQITYDYSMTVAPTDWQMKCSCGATRCRQLVGDVRSVPETSRRVYEGAGNVQAFMKSILAEVRSGKYEIPIYEVRALEKLRGSCGQGVAVRR